MPASKLGRCFFRSRLTLSFEGGILESMLSVCLSEFGDETRRFGPSLGRFRFETSLASLTSNTDHLWPWRINFIARGFFWIIPK